jgi:hypothetical protein
MKPRAGILFALWLVLGLGLLAYGMLNTFKWHADPVFSSVGLAWDWISLSAGIAACAIAISCIVSRAITRAVSAALAVIFVLYTGSFLLFGGEGAVLFRLVLPSLVFILSAATIWHVLQKQTKAV